jgi:hypothetical protein
MSAFWKGTNAALPLRFDEAMDEVFTLARKERSAPASLGDS